MARVVCQVRARPDRVTFLWSEGSASFESYHLTGQEFKEFQDLARQAADSLRHLAETPEHDPAAGRALAEVGHQLFRRVFRAVHVEPGVAGEVQTWLAGLDRDGAIVSLEIVGDHALLPWNLLYDTAPEEGAFHGGAAAAGWQHFWGVRYDLSTGRRAGPLRQLTELERPAVLLVIDPRLRDGLPEAHQKRVREFVETHALQVALSLDGLSRALRSDTPDLLAFFCRAEPDGLGIGDDRITPAELHELLCAESSDETPWNSGIVLVNACGGQAGDWGATAARLYALGLGGLILPEAAAPPEFAVPFGLDFLASFLYQGEPVGRLLQKLRGRTAPLGLLYATCCPPEIRVAWQEPAEPEPAAEAPASPEQESDWPPLPETPYRPLVPYDREDRALFVGRDGDTAAVADLLDAPGARIVLVHGRSGIGKSSLLRAGVLPYLEEGVGYEALRDRTEPEGEQDEADAPVSAVRATNDLPGQLALALCAYCAEPYAYTTPTGRTVAVDLSALLREAAGRPATAASTAVQAGRDVTEPARTGAEATDPPPLPGPAGPVAIDPDTLRAALCTDPALLGRLLTALGERLPREPVVLVEQAEEMFTLAQKREDVDNRRDALEMLRRAADAPGLGKLLVSVRTEYFGRLVALLRRSPAETGSLRAYLLTELREEAMVAAVVQPTLNEPVPFSTEVPFEKYGFRYEEGLPESLVRQARQVARERQESPLALLQVLCAQLAALVGNREDRTVRLADLLAIGGVEDGLSRYVCRLLDALTLAPRGGKALRQSAAFRVLLTKAYPPPVVPSTKNGRRLLGLLGRLAQPQPDGTVTRGLVAEDRLAEAWRGDPPLEAVLEGASADDAGLVEFYWLGKAGRERRYVSLRQDTLAPLAATAAREDAVRRRHGRKVMVDWLWVVIPLGVLALVLLFSNWRLRRAGTAEATGDQDSKTEMDTLKQTAQLLQRSLEGSRFPLYVSQMNLAEAEWRQGNFLRLRQTLLSYRRVPRPPDDLRGFEWYHLWEILQPERVTLLGHLGQVTSMSLSPDGKALASAGMDGTVRLWSVDKEQEIAVLGNAGGPVHAVAFSGDGKKLAAGGADAVVRVWDIGAKSSEPVVLKGHTGPVLAVAFAADGKTVISGSEDGTVKVWSAGGGAAQHTLKGHRGPVLAVALAPDSGRGGVTPPLLASAGADGTVLLWDAAAGKKERALEGHGGAVHALAFAPDGKTLAVGGWHPEGVLEVGSVELYDAATGKPARAALPQPVPVLALAFAGDGKTLAVGGKDNAVRLWDAAAGRERDTLYGHLGWVSAVAVSADGGTVASGGYDNTVKLWSPAGPRARQVLAGPKGWVSSLACAPDDKLVASGGQDGSVRLWDVASGREKRALKGEHGPVTSLAFVRRDKQVLLASSHWAQGKAGGEVVVWDLDKGTVRHTLKGPAQGVAGVAFAPDGKLLASAGPDGLVVVWDVEKGEAVNKLAGHSGPVLCVAFAPDGKKLASGGYDGTVRLWDPQAPGGKEGGTVLKGHGGPVAAVAFAPDGKELVSASFDRSLRRWEVASGKTVAVMRGHTDAVLAAAYSPKGEAIVSGGADHTVRLWDTLRGEQRFTLAGHTGPVRAVAFSADRRTLASASRDGTVRLWRAAAEDPAPVVLQEGRGGQE
jgi:WD40 repeat protein